MIQHALVCVTGNKTLAAALGVSHQWRHTQNTTRVCVHIKITWHQCYIYVPQSI